MSRYPAFVDGEAGTYGVTFPDLPGIVAMGDTMDDALVNAEQALRDYVTETERDGAQVAAASPMEKVPPPKGSTLVAIPLIRLSGRTVRANLTLDEGVVAFMDSEARRRHMTRKAYVEWMTRRIAQQGG